MKDVEITKEPIELYKLLKLAGITSMGSEAKELIVAGKVKLKGVVETQRRKKVFSDNEVEVAGETLRVVLKKNSK